MAEKEKKQPLGQLTPAQRMQQSWQGMPRSYTIQSGAPATTSMIRPGQQGQMLQQIGGHLGGLQDAANTANKERFKKLMELAGQFGATQQRQNQQLTQQELGRGQQSLISRGLGNSTVADTMRQGILRHGQDRGMDIAQRTAELQFQPLMQHQDQHPNLAMYAQLLMQPGAMQGGSLDMLKGLFGIR